jgi:L-asparaginase
MKRNMQENEKEILFSTPPHSKEKRRMQEKKISAQRSVLLIYTGGTIGMIENPETGALESFKFDHLLKHVPELKRFNYHIAVYRFTPPIDSSDMEPSDWAKLVEIINDHYERYEGFVILHGTDTMSYTASALSFMLENLAKPVILTGSQLPIGMLRTDGKENLITAIEIAAAAHPDGTPIVSEVCILFENELMRGNRTTKINAENFNAFRSHNFPLLAHAGIHIKYETQLLRKPDPARPMIPHYRLDTHVLIFTLFPGIRPETVSAVFNAPGLRAVVMKTFGSGNAPQKEWLIRLITEATRKGILVVNITQCLAGTVEMERYKTGQQLLSAGVIGGYDSTPESAITKLMFLLAHDLPVEEIRNRMNSNIAGEITKDS